MDVQCIKRNWKLQLLWMSTVYNVKWSVQLVMKIQFIQGNCRVQIVMDVQCINITGGYRFLWKSSV